jgi:hypothetical protein
MMLTDGIQRHVLIKFADPQKAMDTVTHPVWRVSAIGA